MDNPEYSFTVPRRQLFAFPPDVILSMLENPSSSLGLMKLYQTCKYFYGKRPILIMDLVNCTMDRHHVPEIMVDQKNVFLLKIPIWLADKLILVNLEQRLPKFYRCSITILFLINCVLKYEDFVVLTSEKRIIGISIIMLTTIVHPDSTKASLDELLEHLPNIHGLCYFIDEKLSAKKLAKLINMKFNRKFEFFILNIESVHPSFDMNLFCEFFMKNSDVDTKLDLHHEEVAKEMLKLALAKLDPKWKNHALAGLKEFFAGIDPNWNKEVEKEK